MTSVGVVTEEVEVQVPLMHTKEGEGRVDSEHEGATGAVGGTVGAVGVTGVTVGGDMGGLRGTGAPPRH